MVEEVDGVDAFVAPGGLTGEEGFQAREVDLAGPSEMDCMLVATLSSPRGTVLFSIEIDADAKVITLKTLAGPEKSQ